MRRAALLIALCLAAACSKKNDASGDKGTATSTTVAPVVSGAQPSVTKTSTSTATSAKSDAPAVLLVIANDGFHYKEYADLRAVLEAAGFHVVVAAAAASLATPQPGTGQTDAGQVMPDVALADAKADDFAALVIAGGWGASMYQYAFIGSVDNGLWARNAKAAEATNGLIGALLDGGKPVVGIDHGVSVLAWARVDDVSPLQGKHVTASELGSPALTYAGTHYADDELPSRWHAEQNGAVVAAPGALGDPGTDSDDVAVDGPIVTAQNQNAARAAGVTLIALLKK